jgi:hypothetical protein
LNGFELAGRPMKVNTVTEKNEFFQMNPALLDTDETDRAGIDLGATGRLQLMAKLAEGNKNLNIFGNVSKHQFFRNWNDNPGCCCIST